MGFFVHRIAAGGVSLQFHDGNVLRFGRGTRAEVRFDDAAVALEHAAIEQDDEGWRIYDRGSVTGTLVDGERIEEKRLGHGQVIGIGRYRIAVENAEHADALFLVVQDTADPAVGEDLGASTLRASSGDLIDSTAGTAIPTSEQLVQTMSASSGSAARRSDSATSTLLMNLPSRARQTTMLPMPTRTMAVPPAGPGPSDTTAPSAAAGPSGTLSPAPRAGPTPVPAGAAAPGSAIDYAWAYRLERGPLLRRSGFVAVALLVTSFTGLTLLARGRFDLFNPGSVTAVHRSATGNACSACHAGWRPVDGSTCQSSQCHANVMEHQETVAEPRPCLDCHTEHAGLEDLRLVGNGGCVDCHRALGKVLAAATAAAVASRIAPEITGFADGEHPPFTVREDPGALKFDHAWHLERLPNVKLECASCHQAGAAGELAPVVFEDHCQRCHHLVFDQRRFGSQEALHEPLGELLQRIAGLYSLQPDILTALSSGERQRLRGRSLNRDQQLIEVARWNADALVRNRCSTCHTLDPGPPGTGRRLEEIRVRPVLLRRRWLESSVFRHAPHLEKEIPCESCHQDAAASRRAGDVLLPRIDSCRSCHRPAQPGDAPGSLGRTDCMVCHVYHPEPREEL